MNTSTKEGLEEALRFLLQTWNNEKIEILNSTKLNAVLSSSDGFDETSSSINLFPPSIKWVLWANGRKQFEWPANWVELTISELAELIMQNQNNEEDSGINNNPNF